MSEYDVSSYFFGFLSDAIYLSGIPLLVATVVSFALAMLQAMTQIQDQTLSQTVKIASIILVFLFAGGVLVHPLIVRTEHLFDQLHLM